MKKKTAFILKGYPRVSETFIAQEIYLLEQLGHEIEIFSMRKARESERQPIISKIKAPVTYIPEYIKDHPFELFWHNLKVFIKKPTYLIVLIAALVKSCKLGKKDPIKRLIQAAWLISKRNLLNSSFHLHSHFIHAPTEMTYYISKITGLDYSISAHAKDIYTIPQEEVIHRVNNSQFITTCTRFNYDFLHSLAIKDKSKINLNYHGIDTKTFAPSDTHCLCDSHPLRLVSVGRLVEKKGYDIIFKALQILNEEHNLPFEYHIFGAGDLKEELIQLVDERGLKEKVRFHYTATHPQIIKFFKNKGIFLCGSQITQDGDRDGIPNTVAEAMSMELPIIATNVSGIPELISHQNSGYLIESKNAQAMTDAILELVNNPQATERMAKQGRKRVEEFFDASTRITELESLLQECLV